MAEYSKTYLPPQLLAESLDTQQLIEQTKRPLKNEKPYTRFQRAWDHIELGIVSGDRQHAEAGFQAIRDILEHPDVREKHIPPYVRALSTLAFESILYERLEHPSRPFSQEVIKHTQHEYGMVIKEVCEDNKLEDSVWRGNVSEMIVVGSLTGLKNGERFPFISSPREEDSTVHSRNHDGYLFEYQSGSVPRKKGMSIKTSTLEVRKGLSIDPDLTLIRVLPVVTTAVANYHPTMHYKIEKDRHIPQKMKDNFIRSAADLVANVLLCQPLQAEEQAVVDALKRAFMKKINAKAKSKEREERAKQPLTHSLADQLKKFTQ